MNQQPDNLFRDKLENYEKEVPPSAWDRIAAAQPRKKQNRVWLKVAASLLLVAGAGATWMLMRSDASTPSTLVAVQSTKPQPSAAGTPEVARPAEMPATNIAAPAHERPAESRTSHDTQSSGKPSSQRRLTHREQTARVDVQMSGNAATQDAASLESNDVAIRTSSEVPSLSVPSTESQAAEQTLPANGDTVAAAAVTESVSQGVTLTYSTQEVAAYLDKNIDGGATDDDKKQSTLKKLLQKANDLKTNQDTFGELRQRKNEILALNFKNDKRGQKTRN
jgi:hypothetical protein